MKIAVGIIGIGVSIFVMLQAMAVAGLGGLSEEETMRQAGSVSILAAFLMFIAAAFTFGLPKVGGVIFIISAILAFLVSGDFPDMAIWGSLGIILGVLAVLAGRKSKNEKKGL